MNPDRPESPLPGPRKRVLVIEDDADQSRALTQRLRFEGYDSAAAADVPGAVRMARIHQPDLIILDLGLPGGDGYLVVDRLKAMPELAAIPILVLSARDAAQEKMKALEAGAFAYFQKPIANVALRRALTFGMRG